MPLVYRTLVAVHDDDGDLVPVASSVLSRWLSKRGNSGARVDFTGSGRFELSNRSRALVARHHNADEGLTFLGQPIPPHMAAAKLEAAIAWNRARAAAEDAGEAGDDWFVPRISYLRAADGTAGTYVAWVGGQGSLPCVDVVVTPLGQVRWEVIAEALVGAARAETPAPNYRVDGATAAKLDALIAASEKTPGLPDGINARAVRTTEVVQPYLGGILASTDTEALTSAAVLAHQTDDRKKACDVARRLLEVDPD